MWYAKMYFSEKKEVFQFDSHGIKGVPSTYKELPFLESLLSFLEADCKELEPLLRRAFSRLDGAEAQSVRDFAAANPWLGEYALYRALKARFGQTAWFDWPDKDLLNHDPAALAAARQELAEDIAFHQAVQFWFFSQWKALKDHANGLGVRIIGDLPIYVSLDSADVWSERREFLLDKAGRPSRVAGVPPDYFSEEGQLWGNPLYDWAYHKKTGYAWWIQRVRHALGIYDLLRIDHFRGFDTYWAIPADSTTARTGKWENGPGMELFDALEAALGKLPIFADPVSTAKAEKLRPVLGKLHTLKPNRLEAELLSGVKITDDVSLHRAADALLKTGLHRVFISLGGDGVFAADRSGERVHLPVLPAEMVNTTGCGDAFMAAITWAYLAGTDLTGTAKAGLAASAIAMEGAETISPAMSGEALKLRAGL